jgi:spermidine synthase
VKKWTIVEQTLTLDGKTIALVEHDGAYSIRIDSEELVSTRRHASEERIAELACAHLKTRRGARVLVGGLGMGFTLKAALAALPSDAVVVTAEILQAVIAWNQNPALPLAAMALEDPRVTILQQDVIEVIRAAPGVFDSIILDVDNGPAAMTTRGNARLYDQSGIRLTRRALKPGGCAAFWSAVPDTEFERQLAHAGFTVEVQRCRSHVNSGRRDTVFLGRC